MGSLLALRHFSGNAVSRPLTGITEFKIVEKVGGERGTMIFLGPEWSKLPRVDGDENVAIPKNIPDSETKSPRPSMTTAGSGIQENCLHALSESLE